MQPKLRLVGALVVLLVGAAPPLQGQDITARLHGGIVQPLGSTGDYFRFGPSVGVDVLYPFSETLGLTLDLGWDYLNTQHTVPSPTTNLWRYRVGLEAGLVGVEGDRFLVKVLGAAGGTSVKSHEFWLQSRQPYEFGGETINETALTATGGLRLGLRTSDEITWWLTTKLNWQPVSDINQDALQELASMANNDFDPLGSAMSLAITLGVTLW
jgi:hypothetical protein